MGEVDPKAKFSVMLCLSGPRYELTFTGQPQPNGGTSASAALWAALLSRINGNLPAGRQQRFIAPLFYQNGGKWRPVDKIASRDITSGNNASSPEPGKGYKAGAGFDALTGWGVPDGSSFSRHWPRFDWLPTMPAGQIG